MTFLVTLPKAFLRLSEGCFACSLLWYWYTLESKVSPIEMAWTLSVWTRMGGVFKLCAVVVLILHVRIEPPVTNRYRYHMSIWPSWGVQFEILNSLEVREI